MLTLKLIGALLSTPPRLPANHATEAFSEIHIYRALFASEPFGSTVYRAAGTGPWIWNKKHLGAIPARRTNRPAKNWPAEDRPAKDCGRAGPQIRHGSGVRRDGRSEAWPIGPGKSELSKSKRIRPEDGR